MLLADADVCHRKNIRVTDNIELYHDEKPHFRSEIELVVSPEHVQKRALEKKNGVSEDPTNQSLVCYVCMYAVPHVLLCDMQYSGCIHPQHSMSMYMDEHPKTRMACLNIQLCVYVYI